MNFNSKKTLFLLAFGILLVSCETSRPVYTKKQAPIKRESPNKSVTRIEGLRALDSKFNGRNTKEIDELLKDARKYLGTPYKFGGSTSKGFDCSGFTLTVFEENSYLLPRRSEDQAQTGDKINIKDAKPGDLLFFATSGGTRVSHVGIVYDIGSDGEVKFIHASTSKGVVISSLNEKYWNKAYLHAQRVL